MFGLLLEWLVLSAAFFGTAQLLEGVKIESFGSSLVVTAIYATLNLFLGWLLFTVFAVGTLGLGYLFAFVTWWVIGAIMLMLTDAFTKRLSVKGFGTALVASAVISLFSSVGHWVVNTLLA